MRSAPALPADLTAAIERAGYYPALVADVVESALGPDTVGGAPRPPGDDLRPGRGAAAHHGARYDAHQLVIAHADDHEGVPGTGGEGDAGLPVATATSETVPLTSVRGVMLTHVVSSPDSYVPGSLGREITLTIGWGAVARIDIVPATCGDPECDADHGFEGTVASDDISLRISADADGDRALTDALGFARTLSGAIGGPARS
jgi:hypothetical protein